MNQTELQIDAFAVAELLGLRRRGSRWWCPSCQTDTRHASPDLSIGRDGRLSCFKCGLTGNIFSLIMAVNGCDYPTAAAWLADATKDGTAYKGMLEAKSQAADHTACEIKPLTPAQRTEVYKRLLGLCVSCSAATTELWLAGKGLAGATLDRLGVRFLPAGLQWPVYRRLSRDFGLETMLAAGLCAESDDQSAIWPRGATFFRRGIPVLVIPYRVRGDVTGLKLRPIATELPADLPRFVMVGTGPLYNLDVLAVPPELDDAVFLCEGESDCWSLAQVGLNAIGIAGASNVAALGRPDVLAELRRREVYCAFDADAAGNRAADELTELFLRHGLRRLARVKLPDEFKDVNEVAQEAAA
ncbi:MAG: toprim domain-containing protein [bacterium]|nr:toprim domain-containing protein [bacterium]